MAAAQGALADAKDDYERALALHSALAQDRTYPAMYEALGDVKTRMKDYSGAKSDLQASLDGYRKFEDPVGVAMACRDLGTIEDELGNYQEAERWFKTSLESISGLAKWDIVADVHSRQARILLKKGRISEARNLVVGSLEYWKKQNHARWIAASLLQLGEIELAGKEFPRAIELLGESKKVFSEVGDRARTELAEKRLNEAVSGQGMLHGKE